MLDSLTVEVYNADYRCLDTVPWVEGVQLLLRGRAYIVERRNPAVFVHSPSMTLELPASVSLTEYAHRPYRPPAPTRANVLRRDGRRCGYCGAPANTLDHILPRSRGGGDVWINLVAACEPCNGAKADRTPAEAGMSLVREPFEPRGDERFWFPELV